MKVTNLQLHPVRVPRRYGTVIAQAGGKAKRTVTHSTCYLLEVRSDTGLTGWGEISDVEPDDQPEDLREYEALLGDLLGGRPVAAIQQLHHDLDQHFDMHASGLERQAACGLEMALYDLLGQSAGRPVHDLLGGAVRRDVVISWVAYIREDLDQLREEIRRKRDEGFRAYKLKVGVDIDLDEERLAVLRETAGPQANIKVDANAGWTVEQAVVNIPRLNRFQLAGVETPVPREDPRDIAAVRRQVDVPILEHVGDLSYGLELVKHDAVDVFNVATTGAGGIWRARQVVTLAQAAGIGVLLGSTVEMGPGTLAQLHLAATIPNLTLPSDLIGPALYTDDVLEEPLRYRAGKLAIPDRPGLGIRVSRDKLRELAAAES